MNIIEYLQQYYNYLDEIKLSNDYNEIIKNKKRINYFIEKYKNNGLMKDSIKDPIKGIIKDPIKGIIKGIIKGGSKINITKLFALTDAAEKLNEINEEELKKEHLKIINNIKQSLGVFKTGEEFLNTLNVTYNNLSIINDKIVNSEKNKILEIETMKPKEQYTNYLHQINEYKKNLDKISEKIYKLNEEEKKNDEIIVGQIIKEGNIKIKQIETEIGPMLVKVNNSIEEINKLISENKFKYNKIDVKDLILFKSFKNIIYLIKGSENLPNLKHFFDEYAGAIKACDGLPEQAKETQLEYITKLNILRRETTIRDELLLVPSLKLHLNNLDNEYPNYIGDPTIEIKGNMFINNDIGLKISKEIPKNIIDAITNLSSSQNPDDKKLFEIKNTEDMLHIYNGDEFNAYITESTNEKKLKIEHDKKIKEEEKAKIIIDDEKYIPEKNDKQIPTQIKRVRDSESKAPPKYIAQGKLNQEFVKYENNLKKVKKGGNLEGAIGDYTMKLASTNKIFKEYNDKYKILSSKIGEYNIDVINKYTHIMFLTAVLTDKIFKNTIIVYQYINKGTVLAYLRTIKLIKINIKKKSNRLHIYLLKYHNTTIEILDNFFNELSEYMDPRDIIDVYKCKGSVLKYLIMFNYFKNTLETYKSSEQPKITIYARLNDIETFNNADDYNSHKMFISDYDRKIQNNTSDQINGQTIYSHDKPIDSGLMYVRENACPPLQNTKKSDNTKKYKFTEVYDTINYEDNESISKSMSLDVQLSEGKGVAIMSYGYSGTGKTYTLFGGNGISGILQSTIRNMADKINSIHFRVFELYGYGQTYSYYWRQGTDPKDNVNKIANFVIAYNITVSTETPDLVLGSNGINNGIDKKTIYTQENIKNYIERKPKKENQNDLNYVYIEGASANTILKNFKSFTDTIETERKNGHIIQPDLNKMFKAKTIRDTPNNTESSRSVLIYDFRINLKNGKDVCFLIVDLPGKEQIKETYVDEYFNNELIQKMLNIKYNNNNEIINFLKGFAITMALNPIGTSLFTIPTQENEKINYIIINTFNNITTSEERMKIYKEPLKISYITKTNNDYTKCIETTDEQGTMFIEEKINADLGKLGSGAFDDKDKNKLRTESGTITAYRSELKTRAVIGIHLLNRLIMTKNYNLIEKIFEALCDHFINDIINDIHIDETTGDIILIHSNVEHILCSSDNKITKLNTIKGGLYTAKPDISMIDLFKYDYFLTPFEGIYINENIVGLIKFLSDANGVTEDKKPKSQSEKLTFILKQQESRYLLFNRDDSAVTSYKNILGSFDRSNSVPKTLFIEKNKYDPDAINELIERTNKSYDSNKIYNPDHPLITDILSTYLGDGSKENPGLISDYKVFYLFGNYTGQRKNMKCMHQFNLLTNTKDFIEALTLNLDDD